MIMRSVYLNGEFVEENDAKISVFDRGVLFADAVYEVTSVVEGKLFGFDGHIERLQKSLDALKINVKVDKEKLLEVHRELVKRNELNEGMVYMQYSRGTAKDRDFEFPENEIEPTLFLFTQEKKVVDTDTQKKGIKIVSVEDLRWKRRDIKTVQLLYPSLAKMEAKSRGADDAWFVEEGFVTEGTSNNAHIVKEGVIITRELSNDILHGITRKAILECARSLQMKVEERAFTIQEAQNADEVFTTSASGFATPVIEVDGVKVGNGKPGEVTDKLRNLYIDEHRKTAL